MLELKVLHSLAKIWPDMDVDGGAVVSGGEMLLNERHNFQVAYRLTDRPHWGVGVRVESDLGEALSVRFIENVPCDHPVFAGNEDVCEHPLPGLMPDLLRPIPPVLWAYKTIWRGLWLTVDAEKYDVTPGEHTIRIIMNDDKEIAAEYRLTVYNYRLPDQELPVTNWFHSDGLCNYYGVRFCSEKYWEILENFVTCAVRGGVNAILVPVFTPPLDTAQGWERLTTQLVKVYLSADGAWSFDFSDLRRYIEICLKCRAKYLEISHLYTQWGCRNAPKVMGTGPDGVLRRLFGWETDGTGPEYSAFLRAFLGQLKPFLEDMGVFGKCFFHVSDEPDWSMRDQYAKGAALIREFVPEMQIIDAISDPEFYIHGLISTPVAALTSIDRFIDADIKNLWGYYCCGQIRTSNRFLATPSYRNRVLGCQLFRYDIKGFLQWGYNFYNSHLSYESVDPFASSTGGGWVPGGDTYQVYPGPGCKPLESMRFNVFAEALADYRALKALLDSGNAGSRDEISHALGIDELPFVDFKTSAAQLMSIRSRVNKLLAGF
jgi:hypothetical protein